MKNLFRLLLAAAVTFALPCFPLSAQQNSASTTAALVNDRAELIPNMGAWTERAALKEQLLAYHACTCTCGCYATDLEAETDRAIAFLQSRVAQKKPGEKLALVLDIDETSLSNWEEMQREDFSYHANTYKAWELSAKATALPGTLKLYNEARKLGVSVFFLTGRPENEREATALNLKQQGYEGWQQLILRAPHPATESTSDYKSAARKNIVEQGYTLAVNVGDQWSDLRDAPQAELSVKLPNPFYLLP
jgi:acid phosphatase